MNDFNSIWKVVVILVLIYDKDFINPSKAEISVIRLEQWNGTLNLNCQ
jgi:hypothetical protein